MARDEAWMREYQRLRVIRAEEVARMEAAAIEEQRVRDVELQSAQHVSNTERLFHNVTAATHFLGGNNPIPATTAWRTDASTTFNIPDIRVAAMAGTGGLSVQRVGISSNRPRTTTVGDKFSWLQ